MPKIIIFVGPQGSGKSLQALIISKLFKAKVIKAIPYTLIHLLWIKAIVNLAKIVGKTISVKVYEDAPPITLPTPALSKRLMPLYILMHIVTLFIDNMILFLRLLGARSAIVIEDEGFIYKHLADLLYWCRDVRTRDTYLLLKIFINLALRSLYLVHHKSILFFVYDYDILRLRYWKQREYDRRRKVEQRNYIVFQLALYKAIGADCVVDAGRSVKETLKDIITCLKLH